MEEGARTQGTVTGSVRQEDNGNVLLKRCRSNRADIRLASTITDYLQSGRGRAANSMRQGFAIQRAHRTERLTRALSIAMPVFAYICR